MDKSLNQFFAQRSQESLAASFHEGPVDAETVVFLSSPCDRGVQLNGGRLGARWAPPVLLNSFKRLARPAGPESQQRLHHQSFSVREPTGPLEDLQQAQSAWLERFVGRSPVLHLGGGHDHVLPLLQALGPAPVCVLNVDAHLDTRTDDWAHSGNPFRRFAQSKGAAFRLYQFGIHPFANTASTQSTLPRGARMDVISRDDCESSALVRQRLLQLEAQLREGEFVVFSLDCDALSAGEVRAVSAPNHRGLTVEFVRQLVSFYLDLTRRRGQKPVFGIYEFNPLYDDSAGSGARVIAGLMYQMVFDR